VKIAILDGVFVSRWRHVLEQLHGRNGAMMKLDGFHAQRSALRRELGIDFEHVHSTPATVVEAARRLDADVLLYIPEWSHSAVDVARASAELRALIDHAGSRKRLVLYDSVDQTSSPFFGALPNVDLFLKSQIYRDSADYLHPYAGGYAFTDWLEKGLGWDLEGWHFGTQPDPAHLGKVVCGWNFGASRFYSWLTRYARIAAPSWSRRPTDINTRFLVGSKATAKSWEWYQAYRAYSGEKIRALASEARITGFDRVTKPAYLREIVRSKIVFSPFGWGEVCLRDYEAIAAGALLVKPDMGHLRTSPDIFENGVTYVATRWDLADLADLCRHHLAHPAESEAIAREGQSRLLAYLERGGFRAQIGDVLQRLGIGTGSVE
jgi:hypothetical protein